MTDRLISLNAAIEAVLSVPPGTPCRGLAIREALCALPDAWQPIETYEDGTHVLFWFPNGEKGIGGIEAATAYRDKDGLITGGWTHGGPNSGLDFDFPESPTHWQALPEPPK